MLYTSLIIIVCGCCITWAGHKFVTEQNKITTLNHLSKISNENNKRDKLKKNSITSLIVQCMVYSQIYIKKLLYQRYQ